MKTNQQKTGMHRIKRITPTKTGSDPMTRFPFDYAINLDTQVKFEHKSSFYCSF